MLKDLTMGEKCGTLYQESLLFLLSFPHQQSRSSALALRNSLSFVVFFAISGSTAETLTSYFKSFPGPFTF